MFRLCLCTLTIIVVLAFIPTASAASCETPELDGTCSDGNVLLQGRISMQNMGADESQDGSSEGLRYSDEAIRTRSEARVRLTIEKDLAALDAFYYRAFDVSQGIDDNIKLAFEQFAQKSGLYKELNATEVQLYRQRFADYLMELLKHDGFLKDHLNSTWLNDIRKAFQGEKPVVTAKLIKAINDADLGYTVVEQPWMANKSKSELDQINGLKFNDRLNSTLLETETTLHHSMNVSLPTSFDASTKWPKCADTILRNHDQGTCGSCWAFGGLSAFDSRFCIKSRGQFSGATAMLSRGYTASCGYPRNGCSGGFPDAVYNMLRKQSTAIVSGGKKGCIPYFGSGSGKDHFTSSASSPPCPTECTNFLVSGVSMNAHRYFFQDLQYKIKSRCSGFGWKPSHTEELKAALYSHGPVSFGMLATGAFMAYSNGIFSEPNGSTNCKSTQMNHLVTAFGYGANHIDGLNSWGNWGYNGTGQFKIHPCGVKIWVDFDFTVHLPDLPNPLVPEGSARPGPPPPRPPPSPPSPSNPSVPSFWSVADGRCTLERHPHHTCITSPNYPKKYSYDDKCTISVAKGCPAIQVVDWTVEHGGYDKMNINGQWVSKAKDIHLVVPTQDLVWTSDHLVVKSGWRICTKDPAPPTTPAPPGSGTTPPPTPAPPAPVVCSFETPKKPYCGIWDDDVNDDFNWTRRQKKPPSWPSTGPTAAAHGSYYLFTEASSPRKRGDRATLKSILIGILGADATLDFRYNMYSKRGLKNLGILGVKVTTPDGTTTELWNSTAAGAQSSKYWKAASADLGSFSGKDVVISITMTRGNSWRSDIAIDKIIVFRGSGAAPPPTTLPPTTAPTASPTNSPTTPVPSPQPTLPPLTTAPTGSPTSNPTTPVPSPQSTLPSLTTAPTASPTNSPTTPAPPPPPAPTVAPPGGNLGKKVDELSNKFDAMMKLLKSLSR